MWMSEPAQQLHNVFSCRATVGLATGEGAMYIGKQKAIR
jgi:hypothetical protein